MSNFDSSIARLPNLSDSKAHASNRLILTTIGGCVLNRPINPPPVNGFTVNTYTIAGFAGIGILPDPKPQLEVTLGSLFSQVGYTTWLCEWHFE
jgi:hypothetical protein